MLGTPSFQLVFGLAAAALLVALAIFHLYWGLGGRWPGRDERELARKVVGSSDQMASPTACLTVAVLLLAAALLVAASAGWLELPLPEPWARWSTRGVAALFLLRGIAGMFAERIDPRVKGTAFARLNRLLYNPLCYLVAGLSFAASQ